MVEKYNYNVIKKPTGEKTVNYRLFECFENYDRSIF